MLELVENQQSCSRQTWLVMQQLSATLDSLTQKSFKTEQKSLEFLSKPLPEPLLLKEAAGCALRLAEILSLIGTSCAPRQQHVQKYANEKNTLFSRILFSSQWKFWMPRPPSENSQPVLPTCRRRRESWSQCLSSLRRTLVLRWWTSWTPPWGCAEPASTNQTLTCTQQRQMSGRIKLEIFSYLFFFSRGGW